MAAALTGYFPIPRHDVILLGTGHKGGSLRAASRTWRFNCLVRPGARRNTAGFSHAVSLEKSTSD